MLLAGSKILVGLSTGKYNHQKCGQLELIAIVFLKKNQKSPTQYKLKKNQGGNCLPYGEPWSYVRGTCLKKKEDLENDI